MPATLVAHSKMIINNERALCRSARYISCPLLPAAILKTLNDFFTYACACKLSRNVIMLKVKTHPVSLTLLTATIPPTSEAQRKSVSRACALFSFLFWCFFPSSSFLGVSVCVLLEFPRPL